MTRHVQNLEGPVPDVDDVAFIEISGEWGRREPIILEIVTGMGQCGQQLGVDPTARTGPVEIGICENIGFFAVSQSHIEFMAAADMIEVAVAADCRNRPGAQLGDFSLERTQAHSAIDQQIAELKKGLTNTSGSTAVSSQIASFERLKLEEQFSERMYTISQNAYVRARQELEKQQLYLAVVVPPSVPQQATFPRVFASGLMLFTMLLVFWAIGVVLAATIEDQMV